MTVDNLARSSTLGSLSEGEVEALLEASAWYAKYHERMIAELADDPSAMATVRRDRFRDLHGALRKLGVRIRQPEALTL